MVQKEIVFVTGNKNKLKEAKELMVDYSIVNHSIDLKEIQGTSEEIITEKLGEAYNLLNKPLFVEDVSLCIESMNGFPGPYIKDFLKAVNLKDMHLLAGIKNNPLVVAKCFIGYVDDSGNKHIFEGSCKGKVVSPRGETDFGWDGVFEPIGYDETFAEMDDDIKNTISHRHNAFLKFLEFLKK